MPPPEPSLHWEDRRRESLLLRTQLAVWDSVPTSRTPRAWRLRSDSRIHRFWASGCRHLRGWSSTSCPSSLTADDRALSEDSSSFPASRMYLGVHCVSPSHLAPATFREAGSWFIQKDGTPEKRLLSTSVPPHPHLSHLRGPKRPRPWFHAEHPRDPPRSQSSANCSAVSPCLQRHPQT